MLQTIPANYLKPYRNSLENMLSGATEAKRKVYNHHSLFNLKKKKFKAMFGLILATRRQSRRDRSMALKIQSINRY